MNGAPVPAGNRPALTPAAIVDTHCHLDFHAFEEDRADVLVRARQAGVVRILNPGIDLATSRAAIRLADLYPEVYAAVGIHPNDSLTWDQETPEILKELASQGHDGFPGESSIRSGEQGINKVVAIGEIGLDYYRDRAPRDLQRRVFLAQLELAAELELPVIIHNRQAAADLLPILISWQAGLASAGSPLAGQPGVLHSFSEDESVAQAAAAMHFMLGITGPVTFRNAPGLQQVVAALPLDRLLVETDAPFLTPHPHRGRRNEPGYVRLVVEKIAEIQNQAYGEVAEGSTSNARQLFRW